MGADLARCRDRLCPLCSLLRGREVKLKVLAAIAGWDSTRFITLTLKARPDDLATTFKRCFTAFEALRRSEVWTDNVRGAIAIPEVTIGRHGQWHVHLHVLCTGSFVPHAQLKQAWYEATGDSFIVDVQAVHSRTDAAKYVAGYVAKPGDVAKWDDGQIREWATSTKGMRFLRTYGIARCPAEVEDDTEPDVTEPATHVATIHHVLNAEQHSEHVRHAVDILSRMGMTLATALDRDVPSADLPPVDAREVAFALSVARECENAFPKLPDPAELESERKRCFGLPPDPISYKVRMEQLSFDIIKRPRHV